MFFVLDCVSESRFVVRFWLVWGRSLCLNSTALALLGSQEREWCFVNNDIILAIQISYLIEWDNDHS